MPLLTRSILRSVSKLALSVAAMAMMIGATASRPTAPQSRIIGGPVADRVLFPEVRLRKLHLVRPDLIPYPIFYEIYC